MSEVGLAGCDVEKGNTANAIKTLEAVIRDNDHTDFELFGRCYNALGLAYEAAGQNEAALDASKIRRLYFNVRALKRRVMLNITQTLTAICYNSFVMHPKVRQGILRK